MSAAVAMHAKDAVLIPPSARVLVGDAVQRALGNPAGATIRNTKIDAVQAGGNREIAYLVGTFEYEVVRGTDVSTITGPFVIVWTRDEDGEWQVQVDMWNLDRSRARSESEAGNTAEQSPSL